MNKPYPKIDTVFKRDPDNKHKTLLLGQFSRPAFEYLADNDWLFTEKIDGTNIRVMWHCGIPTKQNFTGSLSFGGKTDAAQIPAHLVKKLGELFTLGLFMETFEKKDPLEHLDVTLYGEGYGAKIQKGGGKYIPDGCDFILFDVRVNGIWLERHNVIDVAQKLRIKYVPVLATGTLKEAINLVRGGLSSLIAARDAEGLVMRPTVELFDRMGRRIITKIKHKDFG